MNAGIAQTLLIAAAGYLLLTRWDYTRQAVARQSGYHLFFQSTLVGILLMLPGWLLSIPGLLFFHDSWIPKTGVGIFFSWCHSFILAILIPWMWDWLPHSKEQYWARIREAAKDRGNLLEILLEDAKTDGELVELSLKNGKVYVGFVVESGIASKEQNTDISLIPAWSGYREKDTRKLLIAYDYSAVVMPLQDRRRKKIAEGKAAQHNLKKLWGEDFCIVIPMEQIEIARAIPKDQAINYEFTPDAQSITTEGVRPTANPGVHTQKKPVDVE